MARGKTIVSRMLSADCWMFVLTLAAIAGCNGCGRGNLNPPVSLADSIAALVSNVHNVVAAPEQPEIFFSKDASIDEDLMRYGEYLFSPTDVDISGDTATVKLRIEDNESNVLGTVEWTVVKEGEEWKIKTAPLPD